MMRVLDIVAFGFCLLLNLMMVGCCFLAAWILWPEEWLYSVLAIFFGIFLVLPALAAIDTVRKEGL